MARPVLYVLAGVNGAGKSSIGGHLLKQAGLDWFNPDTFARELLQTIGGTEAGASAAAWGEGMRRLDEAVAKRASYAFKTTLGGRTVAGKIRDAARTHDVIIWFCGLSSPEQHIRRVAARVKAGGPDIPAAKIRERYPRALQNLIRLMPVVFSVRVYDNSTDVGLGKPVPDPVLVLEVADGTVVSPKAGDARALSRIPDWAKPLVEAAIGRTGRGRSE